MPSCLASAQRHFLPGLGQLLKSANGGISLRRTQNWQRVVPHRTETIFRAVADVDEYADFLPWCLSSRVVKRSDKEGSDNSELSTEITVGYQALKSTLSSRVTVSPMARVHSESEANEYLEHLSFTWDFQELGNKTCRLDMQLGAATALKVASLHACVSFPPSTCSPQISPCATQSKS